MATKKLPPKAAPAKRVAAKSAPVAVKKGFPAKKAAAGAPTVKKGFPARKPGAKRPAKKNPLPLFKAPADFKPHFLLVSVSTEKDGLFGADVSATRFLGKFDRDADEKKKSDLAFYDPTTLVGIAARLGAVTFKATNDKKLPISPKERADYKGAARLPASTTFEVLIRVGRRVADNALTAGVKQVFQVGKSAKTGRVVYVALLKTDPAYRLIRRVSRVLPAAFLNVQMPPKRTRGGRKQAEESDDE
jgi:hypothetical protein